MGIKTVLADDPMLTNRSGSGRQPTRVILDDLLATPINCRLVASADKIPLLIATTSAAATGSSAAQAQALRARGAEVLEIAAGPGGLDLAALLDELGRRQWMRLLVEGGSTVLGSFIGQKLADELNVFVAPRLLGGHEGMPCISWVEADTIDQAHALPPPQVERIEEDLLLTYLLNISHGV